MNKKSKIAIIGRPNVGKSTLFNRLVQRRDAIVDAVSGVTRDRHYGKSDWNGKEFSVIDTGGYVIGSDDIFEGEIRKQVQLAIEESDIIIFVVDVEQGITPMDAEVAKILRKVKKPIFTAVNKCDTPDHSDRILPFFSLGLKEPVPISGLNGAGVGDVLDTLFAHEDLQGQDFDDMDEESMSISIVGMPNVGKSSIFNLLFK